MKITTSVLKIIDPYWGGDGVWAAVLNDFMEHNPEDGGVALGFFCIYTEYVL